MDFDKESVVKKYKENKRLELEEEIKKNKRYLEDTEKDIVEYEKNGKSIKSALEYKKGLEEELKKAEEELSKLDSLSFDRTEKEFYEEQKKLLDQSKKLSKEEINFIMKKYRIGEKNKKEPDFLMMSILSLFDTWEKNSIDYLEQLKNVKRKKNISEEDKERKMNNITKSLQLQKENEDKYKDIIKKLDPGLKINKDIPKISITNYKYNREKISEYTENLLRYKSIIQEIPDSDKRENMKNTINKAEKEIKRMILENWKYEENLLKIFINKLTIV